MVMAEWLMAFSVEYPCLLSPTFDGGGMAAVRPPELNENDTLSLVVLLLPLLYMACVGGDRRGFSSLP